MTLPLHNMVNKTYSRAFDSVEKQIRFPHVCNKQTHPR